MYITLDMVLEMRSRRWKRAGGRVVLHGNVRVAVGSNRIQN